MDSENENDIHRLDLRNIKITGRTFDPNSPRYNSLKPRTVISDFKPASPKPFNYQPAQQPNFSQPQTNPVPAFDRPELKQQHHPEAHATKTAHHHQHSDKFNWLPAIILIVNIATLALGFINKARFHHPYLLLLIVNILLAFVLYASNKLTKWLYISFQIFLVIVTVGMAVLFTRNYINTNKTYTHNTQEINISSQTLSHQQRYDLVVSQDTVKFDRNENISDSKSFYALVGVQVIGSIVFSVLLIRRLAD